MMIRPFQSFRSRRLLVRVLHLTSNRTRGARTLVGLRGALKPFNASSELWDALRTVGLSNVKVELER